MADLQEVAGGGIRDIRQVDPEGFTIVTSDDRIFRITLPDGRVGPPGPKGDTGAQGPAGEMGSPGADGVDGRDGMNGNDGANGVGVSFAQVLKDGSLALMLTNGEVINAGKVVGPQGEPGPVGRPGVPGPAGADGRTIHSFSGPPDGAIGEDGDYAIDHSRWRIYGPKSGLSWGPGQDLLATRQNLDQAIRSFNGGGGGGRGRIFGMGAPSAGISTYTAPPKTPTPTPLAGWNAITGDGAALAARTTTAVASDPTGLAFHVMLRGESAGGAHYLEVVATRLSATSPVVDHVIAWEMRLGATPPTITPEALVNGGNLELQVTSDVALTSLTGAFQYL